MCVLICLLLKKNNKNAQFRPLVSFGPQKCIKWDWCWKATSCRSFSPDAGNVFCLFESLQFCKVGNMQRKDLLGAFLYGKLSLPTLHYMLTNLNRDPVNHATHEHLGLTEHILPMPFLLEYSLFFFPFFLFSFFFFFFSF